MPTFFVTHIVSWLQIPPKSMICSKALDFNDWVDVFAKPGSCGLLKIQ